MTLALATCHRIRLTLSSTSLLELAILGLHAELNVSGNPKSGTRLLEAESLCPLDRFQKVTDPGGQARRGQIRSLAVSRECRNQVGAWVAKPRPLHGNVNVMAARSGYLRVCRMLKKWACTKKAWASRASCLDSLERVPKTRRVTFGWKRAEGDRRLQIRDENNREAYLAHLWSLLSQMWSKEQALCCAVEDNTIRGCRGNISDDTQRVCWDPLTMVRRQGRGEKSLVCPETAAEYGRRLVMRF